MISGNITTISYNPSITKDNIRGIVESTFLDYRESPDGSGEWVFLDVGCYRLFLQSLAPAERDPPKDDDAAKIFMGNGYQVIGYRGALVVLVMSYEDSQKVKELPITPEMQAEIDRVKAEIDRVKTEAEGHKQ